MSGAREPEAFDRELAALAAQDRWRLWMQRLEAVLFASASPVPAATLARVVGQGVSLELLLSDLAADLEGRSFEVVRVADGWMLRSRALHAPVIRAAGDIEGQRLELSSFDMAVLAAIAYHQPVSRDELKAIFGRPSAAIFWAGCRRAP